MAGSEYLPAIVIQDHCHTRPDRSSQRDLSGLGMEVTMLNYIIRRIGYALIMIVLVSFVSFLLIQLPPADFLDQKLAQLRARGDRSAEGQIETYPVRYNLEKPFLWQN